MIHTRICDLLGIVDPIVLGGMGTATTAPLVAAVSNDVGCKVMYMAGEVPEAVRAAEAGADVLVAQGTEAGGHVVWMASLPLVPMMVKALAPLAVLSAGGIADGRGLAGSRSRRGRRLARHALHGNAGGTDPC